MCKYIQPKTLKRKGIKREKSVSYKQKVKTEEVEWYYNVRVQGDKGQLKDDKGAGFSAHFTCSVRTMFSGWG